MKKNVYFFSARLIYRLMYLSVLTFQFRIIHGSYTLTRDRRFRQY